MRHHCDVPSMTTATTLADIGANLTLPQAKVSCLMLTARRVNYALVAIECFRNQTWGDRELVVVYDAWDTPTVKMLLNVASKDNRLKLVPNERRGATVGYLRNMSTGAASGEYCMQWDDDDAYAPDRIMRQMIEIVKSGKPGCVLDSWLCFVQSRNFIFESAPFAYEGSILIRTDILRKYPYPDCTRVLLNGIEVGEDAFVVWKLQKARHLHTFHQPELYYYRIHDANTCGKQHFENMYMKARRRGCPVYDTSTETFRRVHRILQAVDHPDASAQGEIVTCSE